MQNLKELLGKNESKNTTEDRCVVDENWYKEGKAGYPTAPPESLPQSVSERHRAMYCMGYNYAEWEAQK